MLRIEQLSRQGLQPFSFTVNPMECVMVRGASGAGKTLLLRAVADLDPCEGTVWVNGLDRLSMTAPQWRRLVGYVPAEPGWWAEAIADHFPDLDKAQALAQTLGLHQDVFGRLVSQASTGERLRLALVRALLLQPQVLLLDEPTAALDQSSTEKVEQLIRQKMAQGLAVLWSTHDQAQAARMANRTLTIDGGRVYER